VGRIANLLSAGDNAADALRAFNAIDNLEDSPLKTFIKQGRKAVDDDVVSEGRRVQGELDEAYGVVTDYMNAPKRVKGAALGHSCSP